MLQQQVLSDEQQDALERVDFWLSHHRSKQIFRLFGYAGTGKTTLARHIAETHASGVFAAYTGKAALVLGQSLGMPTTTIHSLIYRPDPCPGPSRTERTCTHGRAEPHVEWADGRDSPLHQARYLILDECSMVDGKIANDLLRYRKPILVLGDPAQLPPVGGHDGAEDPGYFTDAAADVMLSVVHRHSDDSGILDVATDVRNGKKISHRPEVIHGHLDAVLNDGMPDIVIVGKNKTRIAVNQLIRERRGHTTDLPEAGERLICLQNNRKLGLFNGQILTVVAAKRITAQKYAVTLEDPYDGQVYPSLTALEGDLHLEQAASLERTDQYARLAYGYAITAHKAQGSQWDNVAIVDEWGMTAQDYPNWLYTAVTRAVETVRIIRKPAPTARLDQFSATQEEIEALRIRRRWPL